jgi:hypothetical protein
MVLEDRATGGGARDRAGQAARLGGSGVLARRDLRPSAPVGGDDERRADEADGNAVEDEAGDAWEPDRVEAGTSKSNLCRFPAPVRLAGGRWTVTIVSVAQLPCLACERGAVNIDRVDPGTQLLDLPSALLGNRIFTGVCGALVDRAPVE